MRLVCLWLALLAMMPACAQTKLVSAHESNDAVTPDFARRERPTFAELKANFPRPPMRYAPFMLQFWDELPTPERARQVARQLLEQGFNPGYIYPIGDGPGFMAPTFRRRLPREDYLSTNWFAAMQAAADVADQAGAFLGFNVDNGWPAGLFPAPEILKRHPDLKAVSLECRISDVAGGAEVAIPQCQFAVVAQRADAADEPPTPLAAARWVWQPQRTTEATEVVCFRRRFVLGESGGGVRPRSLRRATIQITADNTFELTINGRSAGKGNDWSRIQTFDVTSLLRPEGTNVIAVRATNTGHEAGLIAGLRVELAEGAAFELVTDADWRCAIGTPANWSAAELDESNWSKAHVLGDASAAPWKLAAQLQTPAVVRSATLQVVSCGPATRWRAPEGRWRLYVFQPYFHVGADHGILNYLDPRLAPAFIEVGLEPYAEWFGHRLGHGALQCTLFDTEGDYGWNLAWSDHLADVYQQRKGRDIRQWMPLLFDRDVDGLAARARCDWFDAASQVYSRDWFGAVSDWLSRRNMACSLQVNEGDLRSVAYTVGDYFAAQRACTLPGNDALFDSVLAVRDFKEAASVAEFEGRRHLCEVLGVAGWQMPPTLFKRAANAMITWGVDHIEPHVVYLNRDLATIPYPPDWFTQNPYYPYLHLWTDFCRRASYVNACAPLAAEVLLYCPMDSVWALAENGVNGRDSFDPRAAKISDIYYNAIGQLTAARIGFLAADNYYVQQGRVDDGALRIGDFQFRALVLPPLEVLPTDVAKLFIAFARAGGTVFLLGDLPFGSTERGANDPDMKRLMNELRAQPTVTSAPNGIEALLRQEPPALRSRLRFDDGAPGLLASHRRVDGRDFFWLANNDATPRSCRITVERARGEATFWNCETGGIQPLASREESGGSRVTLTLEPFEAGWLVFDPRSPARESVTAPAAWRETLPLNGPWRIRIDPAAQPEPHVPQPVPPRFVFAAGTASPDAPVTAAVTNWIERPLGSWLDWGLDRFSGYVDYTSTFELPAGVSAAQLDLGDVKYMAQVWLNGEEVGRRLWPPFRFDVASAARPGTNTLTVRVGNLFCNATRQFSDNQTLHRGWGYRDPTREDLDAGLRGPVVVQSR